VTTLQASSPSNPTMMMKKHPKWFRSLNAISRLKITVLCH